MSNGSVTIRAVRGADVSSALDSLAGLRIRVFAEFPYLYDGNFEYERRYLATYAASQTSLFVLAEHDGHVVGASTAIGAEDEGDEVRSVFVTAGIDPATVLYCGESVLDPGWRGQGIGVRFFEERERHARTLGRTWMAFCAVDRAADDPRRPASYTPLDTFWQRRGFVRHPELRTEFVWREHGEAVESPKTLTFWLRDLRESPAP